MCILQEHIKNINELHIILIFIKQLNVVFYLTIVCVILVNNKLVKLVVLVV